MPFLAPACKQRKPDSECGLFAQLWATCLQALVCPLQAVTADLIAQQLLETPKSIIRQVYSRGENYFVSKKNQLCLFVKKSLQNKNNKKIKNNTKKKKTFLEKDKDLGERLKITAQTY